MSESYKVHSLVTEKKSALLVVDMQNDFVHGDGVFAHDGYDVSRYQRLEPTIYGMIETAREHDIPVVFLSMAHNESNDGNGAWHKRRLAKGHPNSCREGTWGAQQYGRLSPLSHEVLIKKHRYSGFIGTDLGGRLKQLQIETLVLVGINTNTCIESTARDAHQLDYHVVLINDATTAAYENAITPSLTNIERHFGLVVDHNEWQAAITGQAQVS